MPLPLSWTSILPLITSRSTLTWELLVSIDVKIKPKIASCRVTMCWEARITADWAFGKCWSIPVCGLLYRWSYVGSWEHLSDHLWKTGTWTVEELQGLITPQGMISVPTAWAGHWSQALCYRTVIRRLECLGNVPHACWSTHVKHYGCTSLIITSSTESLQRL